ncbi:class I adenylate-forming enzyme family protein [Gordonia humi]|uniref:Acyl-coenzyme A synthetase/AMP-(Fatty) acid ligase n=1 Tax=Gordonia humi TaxID=686429 RepID=A0A840EQS0_9ACTN|nr:fatty acid--CoA ligase family protein [Gordonia humi]MBB4133861.1 acyl-coenzyme A synthetase/AMP-(fatty) acid ligase [Gordonia humi]
MDSRSRFRQLLDEAPTDAEAIEFEEQWRTWGDLQSIDRTLDAWLTANGFPDGARVGIVLENRPEHVGVLVSLIARNRCIVTLSGLQPPRRLSHDIQRAELPVVVGTRVALAGEGVMEAVGDAAVLELSVDGVREVKGLGEVRPSDSSPGVIVEMLTSGTTGPPKRVLIRERQFDTAITSSVPAPPTDTLFRRGVTMVVTPLVHIGGFWGALGPLYAGRRVCLMRKFELEPWVRAVERHRPRATGLVPALLRTILTEKVPAEKLRSIEVVTTGTTACPPEMIDQFLEVYGIRVLPTYGATEFAGAVAYWTKTMHEKWWTSKAGSAGRAIPGVTLRVADDDGVDLGQGRSGRLEIRTAQSPVGPDEWLRTSDLAMIDADGFLWIQGRADDAIVRGGFKVHPDTVRKVLESHPAVGEAAVAPLPDDRLGQVPVAAVELTDDAVVDDPSELVKELLVRCREQLLPYEVPVHVSVLPELPRTPSSKVSRVELLESVARDMKRAIAV